MYRGGRSEIRLLQNSPMEQNWVSAWCQLCLSPHRARSPSSHLSFIFFLLLFFPDYAVTSHWSSLWAHLSLGCPPSFFPPISVTQLVLASALCLIAYIHPETSFLLLYLWSVRNVCKGLFIQPYSDTVMDDFDVSTDTHPISRLPSVLALRTPVTSTPFLFSLSSWIHPKLCHHP